MRVLTLFGVLVAATPALAHGQTDHSVAGVALHYLTDLAHAPGFWGGLLAAAVPGGVAYRIKKAAKSK